MLHMLRLRTFFVSMPQPFKLVRVPQDGGVTRLPQQQHPSSLIYISTKVGKESTRAMIDTGSTISAISASYARQLHLQPYIQPSLTTCRTANNKNLNIFGRLSMSLSITDNHFRVKLFVIEDLCVDLLLGGDFLNKHRSNINYDRQRLSLQLGHRRIYVPFELPQYNSHTSFHVKLVTNVAIPPRSCQVIRAQTTSDSMSAIFTPSAGPSRDRQVIIPHALVTIQHDRSIILTMLNASDSTQIVPANTTVGSVRQLDPNDLSRHVQQNEPPHSISALLPDRKSATRCQCCTAAGVITVPSTNNASQTTPPGSNQASAGFRFLSSRPSSPLRTFLTEFR